MRRAGFTLVELVLAIGLLSVLVLALVRLIDSSTRVWARAERQSDLMEAGTAVLDLFARDVGSLEGGPRGDLVADWALFDTDKDGIQERLLQRVRFVRQATAADLLRMDPAADVDPRALGLIEVSWVALPGAGDDPARRPTAVLLRGERALSEEGGVSFLEPEAFDAGGRPLPGTHEEVTGGVLWFTALFASQTTVLRDGWRVGSDLDEASLAWDARDRERPDTTVSVLNRTATGMPHPGDAGCALPRRVRLEFEFERTTDLVRRPRLLGAIEPDTVALRVDDERDLPPVGTFVLVDEEWMELTAVEGDRLAVRRGARTTRPRPHAKGALLHHGKTLVREVPIAMAREDWSFGE